MPDLRRELGCAVDGVVAWPLGLLPGEAGTRGATRRPPLGFIGKLLLGCREPSGRTLLTAAPRSPLVWVLEFAVMAWVNLGGQEPQQFGCTMACSGWPRPSRRLGLE